VGLGVSLSLVLIGLGVPRVVSSLLKGPAIATVRDAHDGDSLRLEELETAARYLRKAAAWEGSAGVRTDLGLLLLMRAEQTDVDDPQREALLDEAAAVLRDGLARAPVRPHAWLRLAYAGMMNSGPSAEVVAELALSLQTGRFVGEIALARIELLLRNWAYLPFEMRTLVGAQIRYAWRHERRGLVELAQMTGTTRIIRFALRTIPGALEEIDSLLSSG
jgi:hypothetical protein